MPNQSTQSAPNQSTMTDDFKTLFTDVKSLLKLTANASGEEIQTLRERLEDQLGKAQDMLGETRMSVRAAANNAEEYVRDHPWQAVSIGLGVGVGLGVLLGVLAAR